MAIAELREALARDPGHASAHTHLAGALAATGNIADAIAQYRMALNARPDLLEPLTSLAWILATSPESEVRQPAEAVRLAERAAALATENDVRVLDTLAAAYAARGDFDRAAATAERALQSAAGRGMTTDIDRLRERLDLYRKRQPYRDAALASAL
jgi:cytochrome c-type biogenesis protein CcmH/NrfG